MADRLWCRLIEEERIVMCSSRVAAFVSAIALLGLTLPVPTASAEPDLGHAICNAIGQQGANLRGFLNINVALSQKGVRNPDGMIHQSVANDCPHYSAALAEADREAAGWNRANGPNGGPGYGSCPPNTYYMPNRGDCER
jgi:hypothetical protein